MSVKHLVLIKHPGQTTRPVVYSADPCREVAIFQTETLLAGFRAQGYQVEAYSHIPYCWYAFKRGQPQDDAVEIWMECWDAEGVQ